MTSTVDFNHGDPDISAALFDWGKRLQRESPIARSEALGGFWIVSRYDDIATITKDPEGFITSQGATLPPLAQPVPLLPLESDPPEHGYYRRVLLPLLTAKVINQHTDTIRAIVVEALDAIAEHGEGDAVADFAARIPARALACVLGFTDADAFRFDRDFSAVVHAAGSGDTARQAAALDRYMSFLREKLAERRADPGGSDVVSALVRHEVDGRLLTDEECLGMLFALGGAGIDTTKHAIGHAVHAIGTDPSLRRHLIDDIGGVRGMVEECLRLQTPAFMTARTVSRPATVGGVDMAPGDRVLIVFGWANRDAAAFADPEALRLDRTPNKHLAFGQGAHQCVGMHLARVEMAIAIEELLARLPDYELVTPDETPRLHGGLMWGFQTLPIRVTASRGVDA